MCGGMYAVILSFLQSPGHSSPRGSFGFSERRVCRCPLAGCRMHLRRFLPCLRSREAVRRYFAAIAESGVFFALPLRCFPDTGEHAAVPLQNEGLHTVILPCLRNLRGGLPASWFLLRNIGAFFSLDLDDFVKVLVLPLLRHTGLSFCCCPDDFVNPGSHRRRFCGMPGGVLPPLRRAAFRAFPVYSPADCARSFVLKGGGMPAHGEKLRGKLLHR